MKHSLWRRGLATLIALIMAASVLVSCKGPDASNDQNDNTNQNKEVIALITQGLSDYTVIRPDTTTATGASTYL